MIKLDYDFFMVMVGPLQLRNVTRTHAASSTITNI